MPIPTVAVVLPVALPLVLFSLVAQASPPAGITREASAAIVGAALLERGAHELARDLADDVGARLSGSKEAERAVTWAEAAMKRVGLSRVRREPVEARAWQRGPISVVLRADQSRPGSSDQALAALALGGTIATPAAGVEAEVIEVKTMAELGALGARAKGAIIFFNRSMARTSDTSEYSGMSTIRYKGPPEAARQGAVAFLLRSAGTGLHRLPHTGITENATPTVPAAALAAEDADLLARRIAAGGRPKIALKLEARELGKAPAFNVVGELPGHARKNEIVLIGAHLDSWDVGHGALDDASGCGIVLDTARILARQRLARTLRVVLFMGEEVDGSGAAAYAAAHRAELPRHVAAMEADSGDGRPLRYGVTSAERDLPLVRRWIAPASALLPSEVRLINRGGADMGPLQKAGVPILEVAQDHTRYFDWHHTAGDTADKIDPGELALTTAAFAHLTYALANAPELLSRTPIDP